jgi:glycine/D-amino acid oxidase-like deaminating enzyme
MPEVWLALGYGGNGITFGAVAADIICSAIGGRRHEAEGLFPLPG